MLFKCTLVWTHRLEVDLLLGSWAEENVPKLSKEQLNHYETIMNQQTIDIYNYMTGKEEPPEVSPKHHDFYFR